LSVDVFGLKVDVLVVDVLKVDVVEVVQMGWPAFSHISYLISFCFLFLLIKYSLWKKVYLKDTSIKYINLGYSKLVIKHLKLVIPCYIYFSHVSFVLLPRQSTHQDCDQLFSTCQDVVFKTADFCN
jgi:hypothetical protein